MAKINWTTQRRAVYEVLQASEDHPTASEVIERLRAKGDQFAYGTVYNSLRYLTDMGLIRELKLGETASRYDARTEDHHHIICQRCGRVDEVMNEIPATWVKEVEQVTGYAVSHAHAVLEGVCAACLTVKP
ncbi:Fur family transcriptional regulator [Paenibacillus mucilaginosus]|uniref:Ferric uptake regulator, Fur family n=2 Tax=Paenibacillus mucilaginosus TaxID=61624 RepID=H6NEC4_9BACL|nr:transcriptional repressor [Paenibacillus mucilaginosus]AFC33900.1 ferric uptake regulator, Fur family [Paenibacillus mucilaginosus 3016]AFH66232.1 Fur family transcriptional regulator [Paenibacillus mucilaginosus K02]MCG7213589.1 transcriptional repressor [Paenibacillus mucilaginosus]WDM27596.1 transcriptional repressor [Paenibacillus mucilaginosus]WFA22276.1 transcriptional repressor [Paenibacillus mucilaginosus]